MAPQRLVDLMDVVALAKTLEDFSAATGFATVAVDAQGVPVTEMCAFTDFCRAIRKDPVRRTLCHGCDAYGGLQSLAQGTTQIYRCHAGLVDFSVPITSEDNYVGAILCGQARMPDVQQPDFLMGDSSWRGDPTLEQYYEKLPVIGRRKIQGAAQTLLGLRAGMEGYSGKVRLFLSDTHSGTDATKRDAASAVAPGDVRGAARRGLSIVPDDIAAEEPRDTRHTEAPGEAASASPDDATATAAPARDEAAATLRTALLAEDFAATVAEIGGELDEAFTLRPAGNVFDDVCRVEDTLIEVARGIAPRLAPHLTETVVRHRRGAGARPSRYASQLHCERLATLIFDEVLRSRPQRQHNLRDLINEIARHPDRALSLTDAARKLHWSPGHLSKLFKSVTGETFVSYVMARRLERAELMLASTNMPVGDIAAALDFSQVNYFSRVFRARTQMSPSEYRRQHSSSDRRPTYEEIPTGHYARLRA